jgi:hypothetical protein
MVEESPCTLLNQQLTGMPDFPQITPTPAQVEALNVTFQRFGHACQVAVNQIVDAFAAVMADEAEQRRQRGPTIGRKRRARRARGRGRGRDDV